MHCYRGKAEFTRTRSFSDMWKCPGKAGHVVYLAGHDAIRDHRRRAKAAIRLENRQALGLPFLKALFAISRWSGLKRA